MKEGEYKMIYRKYCAAVGGSPPAGGTPEGEELEQINFFTLRKFTAEEVFVFRCTLCDNEIDRDYDRFTTEALHTLSRLFVGRTGLFDHSAKARDQVMRIFSCAVEEVPERTNRLGEPYVRLNAKAYLPRLPENESLILEIEAGIKKEISVSCAMRSPRCSVCGEYFESDECPHAKGDTECAKVPVHAVLAEPVDAFEFSFVAIPAQPAAGVHSMDCRAVEQQTVYEDERTPPRHPQMEQGSALNFFKQKLAAGLPFTTPRYAVGELRQAIELLEEQAQKSADWLSGLRSDVRRSLVLAMPGLPPEAYDGMVADAEPAQLEALRACAWSRLNGPQLIGETPSEDVAPYKI